MKNIEPLLTFVEKHKNKLRTETQGAVTYCEEISLNDIDSSMVLEIAKEFIEDIQFFLNEEELHGIKTVESLKDECDHESSEAIKITLKIDKKSFFEDNATANNLAFTTVAKFVELLPRITWSNDKQKLNVAILYREGLSENLFSEFLNVYSIAEFSEMESDCISEKSLMKFNNFNKVYDQVYDDKKITSFFLFPLTWKNINGDKSDQQFNKKLLETFFKIICNKELSENKFLIRGQKTVVLRFGNEEIPQELVKEISDLFEFILDSDKHQDKLSILRNTLTIYLDSESTTLNLISKSSEILKSVKFNFNLYVQDSVKIFLEQKNKLLQEFINTARKFEDMTNQVIGQAKTTVLSLLGTIFLSLLGSLNNVETKPILNVVLLSYSTYFLINLYIVFKQKDSVKNILKSLKKYTEKIGGLNNDESESDLSYETMKKDFLDDSICNFYKYRVQVIILLSVLSFIFIFLFFSMRCNIRFVIEVAKWVIGY